MIAKYSGRKFKRFDVEEYSAEEVEEMIDISGVEIITDSEGSGDHLRGGAPRNVVDKIEEIENA